MLLLFYFILFYFFITQGSVYQILSTR